MVWDKIQNDSQVQFVCSFYQVVELGQGPESSIDIAIVRDIVTEVDHRRWIDRRYPKSVHAQPMEIVKAVTDTVEVADTVAVAILKRSRVDLVNDASLPPCIVGG